VVTSSFVVGVDPLLFYLKEKNVFLDVIIQNLSANVLYFGEDQGVNVANGLRINANGVLEIKDYQGSIWLVASGAASDIRIWMQSFKLSNRERMV
jgi:hypothetical protein